MILFIVGVCVLVVGTVMYANGGESLWRSLLGWGGFLLIVGGLGLMVYGGVIQPLLA